MTHMRGTGIGKGVAFGAAAIVRSRQGFPQVPAIPPRIMDMLSKRRLSETPDVVLIAEDYQTALDFSRSLRWGHVVGIATSSPAPHSASIPGLPVVTDIPTLMDMIEEDCLVLVDAEQGMVIFDPDGAAVAQYQAEYERVAPRLRLYLDENHLPSETLDHHIFMVSAKVNSIDDVADALEAGADALVAALNSELLPTGQDDAGLRTHLIELTSLAAGKRLIINDNYTLSPMMLLEACLRADITVSEPIRDELDGIGLGEFSIELNESHAECLANNAHCALPRLAARITAEQIPQNNPEKLRSLMEKLSAMGVVRITMQRPSTENSKISLAELEDMVAAAVAVMLPVFIDPEIMNPAEASLENLLGAGLAGISVNVGDIVSTKSRLRSMNYSECREELSGYLAGRK